MGFYSIYKIIKDMIRTLLGRKTLKAIILILLITIVILIVDKRTVQAATVEECEPFTQYNIEDYLPTWVKNDDDMHYFFSYSVDPDTPQYIVYTFVAFTGRLTLSSNLVTYYIEPGFKAYTMLGVSDGNNYQTTLTGALTTISNATKNNNITKMNNTNNGMAHGSSPYYYASDIDIYLKDSNYTELLLSNTNIKLPEIATSISDLQTLNFDVLSIDGWDYSTQDLYLLCYDRNSGYTESLTTLYPINEILLNQQSKYFMYDLSADPTTNAIYWIPKDEIGFDWIPQGTYAFRFALLDVLHEGGGFRDSFTYLTDYISFTLDSSITQVTLDDLNDNTKEKIEEQRHNETVNSINNINDFLTDDTINENEITNNLDFNNNNQDITNTNTGFFSRLTAMVSDLVDYDLSEDEIIEIGLPFTTQKIILHSNMLYSKLPQSLQLLFSMFWSYLFGMYLFRFVNKIYIAISTGKILDGFSSSGEVITNDML